VRNSASSRPKSTRWQRSGRASFSGSSRRGFLPISTRRWIAASDRAQQIIDAHVDAEALAEIERNVEDIEDEATARIEAIKAEIAAQVARENDRLKELVAGIELPPAIELPEVELPEKQWQAILVSTDQDWAEQTRPLKARKSYGEGSET